MVHAAPFALLGYSRKTERGVKQFLTCFVVHAVPFALLIFFMVTSEFEAVNHELDSNRKIGVSGGAIPGNGGDTVNTA